MIENILPVAGHPFHQSILRLRFDCVRLRSTFVDVAWHLRRIPRKKKGRPRIKRGERRRGGRKRRVSSGIIGPRGQGQCVKRFQAAGVFGRGEMKISRRYLSPEKLRPRPYFAGHKSINEERTRPLPKKIWVERFLLDMVYRFIRNLSRRTLKEIPCDSLDVDLNSQQFSSCRLLNPFSLFGRR